MPGWIGILLFVVVVLLVIVIHEAGHFFAAKAFGIKVEEFFLGFGPRLWSFRRGETEYGIKAIPAGGYVRIAGMNPFQEPSPEDLPRTFGAKPAWQRAIVLAAGSFTHFVLAFLLLAIFFGAIGIPRATVDDVQLLLDGRRVPAAGVLHEGDEVLEVNGRAVTWEEFIDVTRASAGEPLAVLVLRGGREITVRATPVLAEVDGQRVGRLGISVGLGSRLRYGVLGGVAKGGAYLGRMVGETFGALGKIFSPSGIGRLFRQVAGQEERDATRDPASILGAARLSGQVVQEGLFDFLLFLFASFNVFLGIMNLLPLPPLDGGHLAVLAVEQVTRRKIDPRRLVPLTAVIAGFLILFFVSLLFLDIVRPLDNPFR